MGMNSTYPPNTVSHALVPPSGKFNVEAAVGSKTASWVAEDWGRLILPSKGEDSQVGDEEGVSLSVEKE